MATALTTKKISKAILLTASVFYYKKHKLHREGATATEKNRGGKDIEKQASEMDERKIFGVNGRY